jgi:hypothetical protein
MKRQSALPVGVGSPGLPGLPPLPVGGGAVVPPAGVSAPPVPVAVAPPVAVDVPSGVGVVPPVAGPLVAGCDAEPPPLIEDSLGSELQAATSSSAGHARGDGASRELERLEGKDMNEVSWAAALAQASRLPNVCRTHPTLPRERDSSCARMDAMEIAPANERMPVGLRLAVRWHGATRIRGATRSAG